MNYETISSQSSTDKVTKQGTNAVSMAGDDRDKVTINLPLITDDSLAVKFNHLFCTHPQMSKLYLSTKDITGNNSNGYNEE